MVKTGLHGGDSGGSGDSVSHWGLRWEKSRGACFHPRARRANQLPETPQVPLASESRTKACRTCFQRMRRSGTEWWMASRGEARRRIWARKWASLLAPQVTSEARSCFFWGGDFWTQVPRRGEALSAVLKTPAVLASTRDEPKIVA